ncbi:MAG TPA: CDP-archaeol synthase [Planctomycetota bacterium]
MSFLAGLPLAMGQALWLFAPLLFAAAVAGVVIERDLLRWARRPIDGGCTIGGKRLFGDNKTWRGVLVATAASALFAAAQEHLVGDAIGPLLAVDWDAVPSAPFGALMGLGAMLGELPNSFVKRRLGIAPGAQTTGAWSILFYVWDQVDLLLGAWLLVGFWVRPQALLVAASFVVALLGHPLVSRIGWLIGARRTAR